MQRAKLQIEVGRHTQAVTDISADARGRYAATVSLDDTVRIWSLPSGDLLRTLHPPGGSGAGRGLTSVAMTADGQRVAVGRGTADADGQFALHVFDRESGRMLERVSVPHRVRELAWSPDGRLLAAALAGAPGVGVFRAADWTQVPLDGAWPQGAISIDFDARGRLGVLAADGELSIHADTSARLQRVGAVSTRPSTGPARLRFSPDARRVAASFRGSREVIVFSADTLERQTRLPAPATEYLTGPIAWEPDSTRLVAAFHSHPSGQGPWLGRSQRIGNEPAARRTGWYPIQRGDPFYQGPVTALRGTAEGLLFSTQQRGWAHLPQGQGEPRYMELGSIAERPAAFSADGLTVRFVLDQVAADRDGEEQYRAAEFSLAERIYRYPVPPVHSAPRAGGVILDRDRTLRRTAEQGRDAWRLEMPAAVVAHHVSRDDRLLVVQLADGTFRWHRMDDGAALLALFPHRDGRRWVLWTPDGAYDASPDSDAMVGWLVQRGTESAAEFVRAADARRARQPGRVAAAVNAATSLPSQASRPASGPDAPLAVRILEPASGSAQTRTFVKVRLAIDGTRPASAATEPFTHLRVQVADGSAVVLDRIHLRQGVEPGTYEFDVRLAAKDQTLQLTALDAGRESPVLRLRLLSKADVPRNALAWPEESLFNPLSRSLETCQAVLNIRRSAGPLQDHVDQLLARADALTKEDRFLEDSHLSALHGLEVARAMVFALNGQWASAEEFLRLRLDRRLPPMDSRITGHPKDALLLLVDQRQRNLALLVQAAGARGRFPASRFPADYARDGMLRLEAARLFAERPEPRRGEEMAVREKRVTDELSRIQALLAEKRVAEVQSLLRRALSDSQWDLQRAFSAHGCGSYASRSGGLPDDASNVIHEVLDLSKAFRTLVRATAIGSALEAAERPDQAYVHLEAVHAIALAALGAEHPISVEARAALARVQGRRGRIVEAQALWKGWVEDSQRALDEQLWTLDEAARREVLRNNRRNIDAFLSALIQAAPPDMAAQALQLSLSRKGLLARVAVELNVLSRASTDVATRQALVRLEKSRRELAALLFRPGAPADEIARQRTALAEAETALAKRVRAGRDIAAPPPAATLGRSLQAGEALVDFQVWREPGSARGRMPARQLIAVVARADRELVLVHWPDAGPLEQAIAAYRSAVDPDAGPSSTREVRLRGAAATLSRLLWQPLEPHLQGLEKITIAPDGPVSLVPFHALELSAQPLVSRYTLTSLASPRDIAARAAPQPLRKALVVGAPDYGDGPEGGTRSRTIAPVLQDLVFRPLPGALDESRRVAETIGRRYAVELLTGARATEAALYRAVGPSVLHLATHGFFLETALEAESGEDPLQALARSGLSLAMANLAVRRGTPSGEDGILTALEATTLDLRGTRLVVLSACDTAVGQIEAGEGVHGLARAFSEAGAQAVIATLWPVDDEATREFMLGFYQRFVAGEPPSAAVRAMQLQFIASPHWRDPHFWAPFVLVGR